MGQEAGVVRTILEYFAWLDWPVWRMNSGLLVLGSEASRRVVRGAPAGTADIIGIAPDGRFLAIECKAGRGKTTERQEAFLARIRERNGVAFVARSVEDVSKQLLEAGYNVPVVL